jgi:hypothetical protein
MTDYSWPSDIIPYGVSFYLQPNTGGTRARSAACRSSTGHRSRNGFARFGFVGASRAPTNGRAKRPVGRTSDAFLVQLEGRLNRVSLYDFRRPGRAPTFTNAPITAGTDTVTLIGAAPAKIRVGEYIGGDGRPHIITSLTVSGSNLIAQVRPYFESEHRGRRGDVPERDRLLPADQRRCGAEHGRRRRSH